MPTEAEPRRRWNRESVVQAAAELTDRHGYDALSLALLAKELGIKPPSLYKHIGGLDDLKTAIQTHATQALNKVMLEAAAARSGDAAVLAVAHAYREFMKRHPGLQVALSRPSATGHQGIQDPELEASNRQLLEFAVRLLDGYDLDDQGRIHALRALRSLIHGFALLETTGSFEYAVSVPQSFTWAIENYLNGLPAKAEQARR